MHWKLASGQDVSIENQGAQTIVIVRYQTVGQQRSSNSFTTGSWSATPTMSVTPTGAIVQIFTDRGESTIEIHDKNIQMHSSNSRNNPSH